MITWQLSPLSPCHILVSLYIFLPFTIHLSQIPCTRSFPCFNLPLFLSFGLISSLPSLVHTIASVNPALTFNPSLQFLSPFHNSSHVVLLIRPAALDHMKTTSQVNPVFSHWMFGILVKNAISSASRRVRSSACRKNWFHAHISTPLVVGEIFWNHKPGIGIKVVALVSLASETKVRFQLCTFSQLGLGHMLEKGLSSLILPTVPGTVVFLGVPLVSSCGNTVPMRSDRYWTSARTVQL